jgi:hypothetical protein
MASDQEAGHVSTASFIGSVTSATDPNLFDFDHNGDYRLIDFTNNDIMGRVVSSGIRVRYSGTQLNLGGTLYCLEQPSHQTLVGFGISDLLAFDRCKTVPVSRQWTVCTWQPVTASEFNYTDLVSEPAGTAHNNLCIAIMSEPGNTFDWEYFINFEVIGDKARGKTVSHSAVDLTGRIIAEVGQLPTTYFDAIANGVSSAIGPALGTIANSAVRGITGRMSRSLIGGF